MHIQLKQKELKKLRRQIDILDKIIVFLLNRRTKYALSISRAKKALGEDIYNPAREEQVLRKIVSHSSGIISDESLRGIYEKIMEESRKAQKGS